MFSVGINLGVEKNNITGTDEAILCAELTKNNTIILSKKILF